MQAFSNIKAFLCFALVMVALLADPGTMAAPLQQDGNTVAGTVASPNAYGDELTVDHRGKEEPLHNTDSTKRRAQRHRPVNVRLQLNLWHPTEPTDSGRTLAERGAQEDLIKKANGKWPILIANTVQGRRDTSDQRDGGRQSERSLLEEKWPLLGLAPKHTPRAGFERRSVQVKADLAGRWHLATQMSEAEQAQRRPNVDAHPTL